MRIAFYKNIFDRSRDSLNSDNGFQLEAVTTMGNQVVTTIENASLYNYSPTDGRFAQISNPQISNQIFSYQYLANSSLLETVTKAASGENPALVATRTYQPNRDTVGAIENKAGTLVRSKYDYAVVNGGVNSLGQRMGVQTTFNLGAGHLANAGDTSWGYDNLGQLTSANHGTEDTIDRAYRYDTIGNRLFSVKGAPQIPATPGLNTTGYTPNILNQYDAITPYNASGVAGTPAKPVFDDDGNMKIGPLSGTGGSSANRLDWDAENRLVQVRADDDTIVISSTLYDAQFRRIATTVGTTTTLYLYDGFNCIAEYTGTTLAKTRLWGMDLSGSMQGAGGVGGLLLITDHSALIAHHYPTYDGNGNVSEYLEADGDVAAHFEYDPFGNIVKESYAPGYDASSFSYKFSTKPLDLASGLYYYLYRYYDPMTGRWPSRDPIQERGGINLYGFVGNDGVHGIDVLGLDVLINAQQSKSAYFVGMHANKGTTDLEFWVESAESADAEFSNPANPFQDNNRDGDPNGGIAGETFIDVEQPSRWWPWAPDEPTEADQADNRSGGLILSIHISGKNRGFDFTVDIESEPGSNVLDVVSSSGCVPPLKIDNSVHVARSRMFSSSIITYYEGGEGFR